MACCLCIVFVCTENAAYLVSLQYFPGMGKQVVLEYTAIQCSAHNWKKNAGIKTNGSDNNIFVEVFFFLSNQSGPFFLEEKDWYFWHIWENHSLFYFLFLVLIARKKSTWSHLSDGNRMINQWPFGIWGNGARLLIYLFRIRTELDDENSIFVRGFWEGSTVFARWTRGPLIEPAKYILRSEPRSQSSQRNELATAISKRRHRYFYYLPERYTFALKISS